MTTLSALDLLRHACHGCGACCTGHSVRLVRDEPARIQAAAVALGIDNPVVDTPRGPVLGFVDHHCPFLDPARRCRIHATWGEAAKPAVCQQYPLRSIVVEDGQRVAIDPGCGSNWTVWQTGPALDVGDLLPAPERRHSPEEVGIERALLGLLDPQRAPLSAVLATLAGQPDTAALRDGFAARSLARVQELNLAALLAHEAPTLKPALGPVASLPPTARWPSLTPTQGAFVLELARRSVFLRNGTIRPMELGLVLGTFIGAVVCAADNPPEDTFGYRMTAWTRLLRLPAAWTALFPEPSTLRWLATGQ